jgi:hypothetical protein
MLIVSKIEEVFTIKKGSSYNNSKEAIKRVRVVRRYSYYS